MNKEYLSAFHAKLMRQQPIKISFSGDSTTEGTGNTTGYVMPDIIRFMCQRTGYGRLFTVLNKGMAGAVTSSWLSLLMGLDMAENPDLYVIRWGINDPYNAVSVEQTIAELTQGLTAIRNAKTESQMSILLMSPNTTCDPNFPGGSVVLAEWHRQMSEQLVTVANTFKCAYLDLYNAFPAANMMQVEGIHPSNLFQSLIASEIFDFIFPSIFNSTTYIGTI